MLVDIEIKGTRELRHDLSELPKRVRRKLVRRATRRGAVVLQKAIRAHAPTRRGGGAKNISTTAAKGQRRPGFGRKQIRVFERRAKGLDGVYRYGIAPSRRAFYLAFYDMGTRHQPARPFFQAAVDQVEDAAFNTVIDALEQGIDAELDALGWQ